MDAISGFKLLADSSDAAFFQHPRSPSLFTSSGLLPPPQQPQEVPKYYNDNSHPGLGDDVQVVSDSSPSPLASNSYHLPPVPVQHQAPPTSPQQQQQHSPKPQSFSQQASPTPQPHQMRPPSPQFKIPAPKQQLQPQPQQSSPPTLHPVVVKGLINQDYEGDSSDISGMEDDDDSSIASGMQEEDDEVRVSEMHAPLDPAMKNTLVCLIGEYLNELITLRVFLSKARQCLCAPDSPANNKEVFSWVLRCMLEGGVGTGGVSGHVQRMATFLEENGVTKQEIESSSAAIKELDNVVEFDIGEKRKRREKKSISRGLRSAPNKWCKAESQMLIRLVHENGDKSWKRIAEQLGGGKTGAQCAQHWKRVLSPQIRKGSWDDQEEELLLSLVERYGQSWKNIAGEIKTRTDIQCRYQFQKSCLSRQCEWQPQEDALLSKKVAQVLHESSGSNNPSRMQSNNPPIMWVEVAKFIARAKLTKIPRTALECKQRWYAINGTALPTPSLTLNTTNNNNNIPNTPQQHPHTQQHQQPLHTQQQQPHPHPHIQHPHQQHMPHPHTHNTANFHNINYNNINNNFTMVTQTF